MPSENTASSSVTTSVSPPSTSFAKLKNDVRNVAPKNHNHEMPSSDRNTVRLVFASFRFFQVSVNGFQFISRPGSDEGAAGIKPDAIRPITAIAIVAPATHVGPAPETLASWPPMIVPIRIETNVPISTIPLPPVSSSGCSTCGRYAYLTGPKTVECKPIRNVAASSTIAL